MNYFQTKVAVLCVLIASSLFISCGDRCTTLTRLFNSECRELTQNLTKTRLSPPACNSIYNVKVSVSSCTSASSWYCYSISNSAAMYAVIIKNNGSGNMDSGLGQITNCSQFWANFANFASTDVAGIYIGAQGVSGQSVTCDDASGCTASGTSGCFTGFDPILYTDNIATKFPSGTNAYLGCMFIDSWNTGLPVAFGIPASPASNTTTFFPITLTIGGAQQTVNFNDWGNAQ